jgi:hypothetical protein
MKLVRLLAALSLAAAVLLTGARAGGAFAQRIRPIAPEAYPAAGDTIRVGESLEVTGQPMDLSVFSTADAPDRVVTFYADAFRARGLTPVMSVDPALAHVAAFDPADAVQRFVSALPQAGGGALVLSGTTNPRKLPGFIAGSGRTSLPVPERHRGLLVFRSADAGTSAESAHFVSALAPRTVVAFYRGVLRAEGYSESPDRLGEQMLSFAKRGSSISVAIRPLEKTSGSAVFITRSEVPAR